jgi:hypothetical protein
MGTDEYRTDVDAIQALITRQFGSLCWAPGKQAALEVFAADFHPDASLYPAARPAQRQTVQAFVLRMQKLAATRLRSFEEAVLGSEAHVFGNIAVALAACEMTENAGDTNRGVEALLLIKDAGVWRIVAQAWDTASESSPFLGISSAARLGSDSRAAEPRAALQTPDLPVGSYRSAATAQGSSLVILEPSTERSPIRPF